MGHGIRKPTSNQIFRQIRFCWKDAISSGRMIYLLGLIPRVRDLEKETNNWIRRYTNFIDNKIPYHFYDHNISINYLDFLIKIDKNPIQNKNKIIELLTNEFIRKD